MSRKRTQQTTGNCIFEAKCKVCNSKVKNIIENLYIENMNPRQIMEYLTSAAANDEKVKAILDAENLSESAIRRHLDRHFNVKAGAQIKVAETQNKLQESRAAYKKGVRKVIDSVGTLSHLIDVALINLESLDEMPDARQKHQLTISYMASIKNMIDEFSKLTGELKQEGSIDVNFFSSQITEFANIVLSTIRKLDAQFNMNNQLEYAFGEEFNKQWKAYKNVQNKMVNGELPLNYGSEKQNMNTFNDNSRENK